METDLRDRKETLRLSERTGTSEAMREKELTAAEAEAEFEQLLRGAG